jgi:hypothetical protein
VLIVAAGIATAVRGHLPILRTGWILWSLIFFAISGWAFMAKLGPIQKKLSAAASEGASGADPKWWESCETLSRGWDLWGAIALILPLLAMALMILKPAVPAVP